MAPATGTYLIHDGVGKQNKEDLLDLMKTIDVRDQNPLVKELPSGSANGIYHQWTYYSKARSTGGNASLEGEDYTFAALTNPTRTLNYVESIVEPFRISTEQMNEQTVGGSELKRRKMDALRNLMAKMEFEGIYASGNSGASNTARYMKGILSLLSKSTNASNPTVTEANFNNYLQEIWRETTWSTLQLYADVDKKKNIDSFTASTTKYIDASEKRLINFLNVIETTFGIVELFIHRDLNASKRMFFIDRDSFRWAFYEKPNYQEVPSLGDYTSAVYKTKVTMEALNPLAGIAVLNP